MTTAVEIARAARAALREAFPRSKISVTSDRYSVAIAVMVSMPLELGAYAGPEA
jgi:Large polyvalent protein associated domain 29